MYERSVIISTCKLHSGHCTAVDHRQSVSGVLDQWERRYSPDKGFIYNFAMILTQDLEKWFMVTAHPVPKGTLWMKFEPRGAMLRSSDIGRTGISLYGTRRMGFQ